MAQLDWLVLDQPAAAPIGFLPLSRLKSYILEKCAGVGILRDEFHLSRDLSPGKCFVRLRLNLEMQAASLSPKRLV